jgi:hypothetical protein
MLSDTCGSVEHASLRLRIAPGDIIVARSFEYDHPSIRF